MRTKFDQVENEVILSVMKFESVDIVAFSDLLKKHGFEPLSFCSDFQAYVLSGSTLEDAKALYKQAVKEYKALYVPAKRGAYCPNNLVRVKSKG